MDQHENTPRRIRQLKLPSGRKIEVAYFGTADPDLCELHHCGTCGSDLVHPIDWQPTSKSYWQVTLRCPNCEWCGTGVFSQRTVDRFDAELDRGTDSLLRDLEKLASANMTEDVARFISALDLDLISPDDFRR
jgi:hypothetical protein